VKIGPVVYVLI